MAPPSEPFNDAGKKDNRHNNNSHDETNNHPQFPKLRKSVSEDSNETDYSDEDIDRFDEVGQWERPAPTSIGTGIQMPSLNRPARLASRHESSSPFRARTGSRRNQYIDDGDDDDARSASGFSVSSRGGQRTSAASGISKPLGMPSNAIVASMLFQTQQYDIDKNDVQEKINALEKQNFQYKKVRTSQGGIPDAVNTDDDYMTTISSFSEGTSAYLQDTWRQPSRDLLNHFASARALDMDYRRRPVRNVRPEPQAPQHLYEA